MEAYDQALTKDEYGYFTTLTVSSNISIKFRLIHGPQSFVMGSTHDDGRSVQQLARIVRLTKSFWLAEATVSQELWFDVMGARCESRNQGHSLPVDTVSWDDAQFFISVLNDISGFQFRMPTEAEWECACRANPISQSVFNNGKYVINPSDYVFSCDKFMPDFSHNTTQPVNFGPRNGWGFYCMHGNVYEFCSDWFGNYDNQESINPVGPKFGQLKVLRGGSYQSHMNDCASHSRMPVPPDLNFHTAGIRLAADVNLAYETQCDADPFITNRCAEKIFASESSQRMVL